MARRVGRPRKAHKKRHKKSQGMGDSFHKMGTVRIGKRSFGLYRRKGKRKKSKK